MNCSHECDVRASSQRYSPETSARENPQLISASPPPHLPPPPLHGPIISITSCKFTAVFLIDGQRPTFFHQPRTIYGTNGIGNEAASPPPPLFPRFHLFRPSSSSSSAPPRSPSSFSSEHILSPAEHRLVQRAVYRRVTLDFHDWNFLPLIRNPSFLLQFSNFCHVLFMERDGGWGRERGTKKGRVREIYWRLGGWFETRCT